MKKKFGLNDAALFGNLGCVLLGNFFGSYAAISLVFNALFLLKLGYIVVPSIKLRIFFGLASFSLFGIFALSDQLTAIQLTSVVCNLMLFVCCVFIVITLISRDPQSFFTSMSSFSHIVCVGILADVCFTFFYIPAPYEQGSGFQTLIFTNPQNKFFVLAAVPFLLQNIRRNILLIIMLAFFLLLGQRGAILALICMICTYAFGATSRSIVNGKATNSILIFIIAILIIVGIYNVVSYFRVTETFSTSSAIARLIIWSVYGEYLITYPFGTGPFTVYYTLSNVGFDLENLKQFNWVAKIVGESNFNFRAGILARNHAGSADSFHVQWLTAFGLTWLLILMNLAYVIFTDVLKSYRLNWRSFRMAYLCASVGIFVYGVSISLHFSVFFVTSLYFGYFWSRKT